MAPNACPRDHNWGPVSSIAPGPLEEPGVLEEPEEPGAFSVLLDDDTREGTGLSCMVELIRLTSSSSVSFYKGNCPRTQLRSLEKITLASGAEVTDSLATASSL